jgi:hypothetical protein
MTLSPGRAATRLTEPRHISPQYPIRALFFGVGPHRILSPFAENTVVLAVGAYGLRILVFLAPSRVRSNHVSSEL